MKVYKIIAISALSLLAIEQESSAQLIEADRVANIENAASELGKIHMKSGMNGEREAFLQCYARELPKAQTLTPELEVCIAQDLIASKSAASFFTMIAARSDKLPPNFSDPKVILGQMTDRVMKTFKRFSKSVDEIAAFNQIVEKQGMQAYGHAMFPDKVPSPND